MLTEKSFVKRLLCGAACTLLFSVEAPAVAPDAVGGGYTDCGLLGEYFGNADLSGQPVFTRRDVRIDFDWGDLLPVGGSRYRPLREFPRDNFSVRWTGRLMPRFSEDYIFRATADEGIRVRISPAGAGTWTQLFDQWDGAGVFLSAAYSMTAGSRYDIEIEYRDISGPAHCRILWQSQNTPREVIDPVTQQALNAGSWLPMLWADQVKVKRWDDADALDEDGSITGDDHEFVLGEMRTEDAELSGTYRVSFRGKARVIAGCCNPAELLTGTTSHGKDKPRDAGYDAATNTTTFRLRSDGSRLFVRFRETARDGGPAAGDGITDLHMMRPVAPMDSVSHDSSEVVYRLFKDAVARNYTCLRYLMGANGNTDSVWADRTRPTYAFFLRDRLGIGWPRGMQENWEYLIMLANETGKDLSLTLPIKACDGYFTNLANLLKYGSDGDMPYTSPQTDPEYPPLNPNLRVYVEVGNEIWNWAFLSTGKCRQIAVAQGQADTPLWQIMNYDGTLNQSDCGIYGMRRWLDIRTVACSNMFRQAFGDAAMGTRVRMLLHYQYDNEQETAAQSFEMFSDYYNNGLGDFVADPHPPGYYLWGSGGATYFGVGNPVGAQSATLVSDSSFETPPIPPGTMRYRPSASPWTFTGDAGIYYQDGESTIDPLDTPDAPPDGSQAAFLIDDGSISATVDFAHSGWYALAFNAAYYSGERNSFDIYFDSVKISPRSQADDRVSSGTAGIGGWGRSVTDLDAEWGSATFEVTSAGTHTIGFVGRGTGGRVLLLDNVRIQSADSLMESGFGSGEALGQVADSNYQAQLYSQATYARTFGLQVVAYEAGWSLGGDHTRRPLQDWCKFHDPRATRINNTAEEIFRKSGGTMNVWGVYSYWPSYSMTRVDTFPLMQSIGAISDTLAAECENGKPAPCTLRAIPPTDGMSWWNVYGGKHNELGQRGKWVSWLFVAPLRADYTLTVYARDGGDYTVEVDGDSVGAATNASGARTFGGVHLVKGGHAVRVLDTRGAVVVDSIAISYTPLSVGAAVAFTPGHTAGRGSGPVVSGWSRAEATPSLPAVSTRAKAAVPTTPASEAQRAPRTVTYLAEDPVDQEQPSETPPRDARGDGFVPPVPVTNPSETYDMRWLPKRRCLPVASVRASSENARNPVAHLADSDLRTRWTPVGNGPHWLVCDLGEKYALTGLSMVWYSRRWGDIECTVEVSCDGRKYVTARRETVRGRSTRTASLVFGPRTARYVRLRLVPDRGVQPSVYELGVHGSMGPCRADAEGTQQIGEH